MYSLLLTKSASKELGNLTPKQEAAVIKHLEIIKVNPRSAGSKKLQGRDEYKFRVGDLRIIYGIDDKIKEVIVYMIDDRKRVYKRLRKDNFRLHSQNVN